MNVSNWIAVISACISVGAMIVTLWQAVISKKTYNLEKSRREEEKPNFKIINLVDSKAVIGANDKVQLQYYLVVSNLSNKDMTIKDIRLRVVGEEKTIVLTPVNKAEMLSVGDNIECNKSIQKWVEFDIGKDAYYNLKIIKFVVEIEDIYSNKQNATIIYMNEEVKENV